MLSYSRWRISKKEKEEKEEEEEEEEEEKEKEHEEGERSGRKEEDAGKAIQLQGGWYHSTKGR